MTAAHLPAEKRDELARSLYDEGRQWLTPTQQALVVEHVAPLIAGWLTEAETAVERIRALDLTCRRLGQAYPDPTSWQAGWNRALEVCQDDLRAALRPDEEQPR